MIQALRMRLAGLDDIDKPSYIGLCNHSAILYGYKKIFEDIHICVTQHKSRSMSSEKGWLLTASLDGPQSEGRP